ncbi:hypothetical protein MNBD_GAMMA10-2552 [hydrothermal vent metagenome]|uniref:DUF7931 domain-containing protein n=1 Tax=hydrothermal vent metagenome TaxID=652676 RepID=A0A3B0XVH9_9ZZZZ
MSIFDSTNFERQGNTDNDIELENINETRQLILTLSGSALRSIKIFTNNLQPELYDNDNFRKTLLDFSRGNRHAKIQILATNTENGIHQGHQLIRLAQQTPSIIQIKNTPEDYQTLNIAFLLIDQSSFVFKRTNSGSTSLHSTCKLRTNRLLEFFTAAWEQAEKDPHTQRFFI